MQKRLMTILHIFESICFYYKIIILLVFALLYKFDILELSSSILLNFLFLDFGQIIEGFFFAKLFFFLKFFFF